MKKREKIKELIREVLAEEKSLWEGVEYAEFIRKSCSCFTKGKVYEIEGILDESIDVKSDDEGDWNGLAKQYFKPSTKEAFEAQNKPEQKTLEEYLKPSFGTGWILLGTGEIQKMFAIGVDSPCIGLYRTKKEALLAQRFMFLRRVAEKCEGYGEGCETVFYSTLKSGLDCFDIIMGVPVPSLQSFLFKTEAQAKHFIAEATRLGLNDWEEFKN